MRVARCGHSRPLLLLASCVCALATGKAHAQLQITEVMFNPGGVDALWGTGG